MKNSELWVDKPTVLTDLRQLDGYKLHSWWIDNIGVCQFNVISKATSERKGFCTLFKTLGRGAFIKMVRPLKSIPLEHLPAQVRATVAYLGIGSGYRINLELDGDKDIEVMVIARDKDGLSRFFKHLGFKDFDPEKTQRVAVVHRDQVILQQPVVAADDEL